MEILSPASNKEHIRVAIDNKANAVYGGVQQWNARNKAINFTNEEYNMVIDELHKNNIKFYLTLNILLLDSEIEEIIEFLKHNRLPDAFIVTDVGLVCALKEKFPNVPLHFSTQFGAHNVDDIKYIETMGGERAILARELTLEELRKVRDNSNIETECFIWGSQCLSYSGLCFFGTLINGGGGNRGKCIITCRDVYSVNNKNGHYLYVPDMDCINLISKLDGIDCFKLEGRRRNPKEIESILKQIHCKIKSKDNKGYLFGVTLMENGLFEEINSRIKPIMMASELKRITPDDVCIKFDKEIPIEFSNEYGNPNVMYVYSEKKKDYLINKKNISLDLTISDNIIEEVLYVNHKGTGHTFFSNNQGDLIECDLDKLVEELEKFNDINVYKIKYKRGNEKTLVEKKLYNEIIQYIINDCENTRKLITNNNNKLNNIYVESNDLETIDALLNDSSIKIIYDIATIENLKNIRSITKKYCDKIIYKLPLFNWKSEKIEQYIKELQDKEVMFTRLSQIHLCRNITFKKKYTDYTIYIWNKRTLNYLKNNNIEEFTGSPELSYQTNENIFGQNDFQVILAGKLPLVYTRSCFRNVFKCVDCNKNQKVCKKIENVDKGLTFEIYCNADYRYILNSEPILNDYSKIKYSKNTKFRYVSIGENLDEILETIRLLKENNYYSKLIKRDYWSNSYECNILEGKE